MPTEAEFLFLVALVSAVCLASDGWTRRQWPFDSLRAWWESRR